MSTVAMRNLGIEPRAPRWQRRILPLNQLRFDEIRLCYLLLCSQNYPEARIFDRVNDMHSIRLSLKAGMMETQFSRHGSG
jgi:hypothetical protein